MSELCFEKLDPPSMLFNGIQNDDNMRLSIWNGSVRINIGGKKDRGFKMSKTVDMDACTKLRLAIEKIKPMAPDSKIPIMFNRWDKEARKMVPDFVLTVHRDQSNAFIFIVDYKTREGNVSSKFSIRSSGKTQLGSETNLIAQSEEGLEVLYDWITKYAPAGVCATRKRWTPPQQGGGSGGGSSSQGGGSSEGGGIF